MKASIVDLNNKEKDSISLSKKIFDVEYRADILSRVVLWQQAKKRSGNHQTKGRSDVTGSRKKIVRQKGTGGARHGAKSANIFVGGGVVFGPQTRDHSYSLNKKVRKLALKVALSLKLKEKSIIVFENFDFVGGKTKELIDQLKAFNPNKALFIDENVSDNLRNSTSNVIGFDSLPVAGLNVLDLLKHDTIFVSSQAIKRIEERLSC